jgi:tetratricopeptide (TPR) repeat protein
MRIWLLSAAATVLLVARPVSADVSEAWYLARARANMKIKNYKAAAEAYRKAIEKEGKSREALKGLGLALQANGETDEAIAAYDRYLAVYDDDPDIAFQQAHFLEWSRYRYRRVDAIRYYRLGLQKRDDLRERRRLAKLLGQNKATLDEAVSEYRRILEQQPDSDEVRSEYRRLLLWDRRYLDEAIEEYTSLARERSSDRAVSLQLARLLAQDPKRITEAIERYRQLLERAPNDRTLRIEYAKVLARDHNRRDEALAELRTAEPHDRDAQLVSAQLLASSDTTRGDAIERYRGLVRENPRDDKLRLEYARLLESRRDLVPEAIEQYGAVLDHQPGNRGAEAGLARAYAWLGDNDRALHHARRAISESSGDAELRDLEARLGAGREPHLGGGTSVLVQQGTSSDLLRVRVPALARTDATAFGTLALETGFEVYQGGGRYATGALLSLQGEARFTSHAKLRMGLSDESARPGVTGLGAELAVEVGGPTSGIAFRFVREPRTDSIVAAIGAAPGAPAAGSISANQFSLSLERRWGVWRVFGAPRVAILSGLGNDVNVEPNATGGIEASLLSNDALGIFASYTVDLEHYGHDSSATNAGGYYSPDFHFVQTPRIAIRYSPGIAHFELTAGPSLQYQALHDGSAGWLPGGDARTAVTFRPAAHLELSLFAAFLRVGDAYSRYDGGGSLSYVF